MPRTTKRNRLPVTNRWGAGEMVKLAESDIEKSEHGFTVKATKRFFWEGSVKVVATGADKNEKFVALFL